MPELTRTADAARPAVRHRREPARGSDRRDVGAGRLTPLDGLRGVAALGIAVFWHYVHFTPDVPFRARASWFYEYGNSLVALFFVLSGFVFSHVYTERLRNRELGLRAFVALRFSRLYPLHLATLLVVAAVQAVRHATLGDFFVYQDNDAYRFVLNVLFVQNGWINHTYSFNAPSWSVAVEIIGYLLFFAVLVTLRRRAAYLSAFVLLVALGFAVKQYGIDLPLLNIETHAVLLGFFVGCLGYELHMVARRAGLSLVLGLTSATLFALAVGYAVTAGHEALGDWRTFYTLVLFPLGILALLNVRPLGAVFGNRPLTYLGDISYSVYLLHFPLQVIITTLDGYVPYDLPYGSRRFFVAWVVLVVLVGAASHRWFEMPAQRALRRRLLPRTPAARPADSGAPAF